MCHPNPRRRRPVLRAATPLVPTAIAALLCAALACGPPKPVDSSSGASPRPRGAPPPARAEPRPDPTPTPSRRTTAVPAKGLRVTGKVVAAAGQTLPATARVALVWVVSSGSPDYVYAFGSGTSRGGRFDVTLTGPPPSAALNAGLLGVGMLLLLPANTTVPTGRLKRKQWRALVKTIIGGADRYGVLYRLPATASLRSKNWMGKFTGGYRCGKGFKPPGRRFEGFNPIPCNQLIIRLGPFKSLRWVNWT